MMNSYSSVDGLPVPEPARSSPTCSATSSASTGRVARLRRGRPVDDASPHRGRQGRGGRAGAHGGARPRVARLRLLPRAHSPRADGALDVALVDRAAARVLASKFRLGLFENPTSMPVPRPRCSTRSPSAISPVGPRLDRSCCCATKVTCSRSISSTSAAWPSSVRWPTGSEVYKATTTTRHTPRSSTSKTHAAPRSCRSRAARSRPGRTTRLMSRPWPRSRRRSATGAEIDFELGCDVTGDDRAWIDGAVLAAERADVALVFVGGESGLMPHSTVGEARDASDLGLTACSSN